MYRGHGVEFRIAMGYRYIPDDGIADAGAVGECDEDIRIGDMPCGISPR